MAYGEQYDQDRSGNYLIDHWRGRLPLSQSYWINGGMIGVLAGVLGPAAVRSLTADESSLRVASWMIIAGLVLALAVWVWGAVGIWRSSARHHARGGAPVWAAAARAMVLSGLVVNVLNVPELALFLRESGRLAVGSDPLGKPIGVRVAGDRIYLDGPFALGSAEKVRDALGHAASIRAVYLTSIGGRIGEADQIGTMIKTRKLDTVAQGPCLSACTLAFVAGAQRSLLIHGRLGFHQPRFPGLGPDQLAEMSETQRRDLAEAGIPAWFVERSLMAPPESMWLPTEPELFAAGVVNSVTRDRVIEDNAMTVRQIRPTIPRHIDAVTTITGVSADGTTLHTRVTIAADAAMINKDRLRALVTANETATVCTRLIGRLMVLAGGTYVQDVVDRHGRSVVSVGLSHCPGGGAPGARAPT